MEEHVNPYAAPRTPALDPTAADGDSQLAGRGQRLAAAMLDGLILAVICYPILLFVLYPAFFGSSGISGFLAVAQSHGGTAGAFGLGIVNAALFLSVFLLINLHLLLKNGQTVGKRVVGIRIDGGAGPGLSLGQVARRYGFMHGIGLVPFLGRLIATVNILCIFRASRRCLHDDVAGTVVVKA